MSDLYAMVDGSMQLIAKGIQMQPIACEPEFYGAFAASAFDLSRGFSQLTISCHMSAKDMREFAKVFAWSDRMALHRRRAIAKARGKNWRNVR